MQKKEWIENRLQYIRGLKSPNEQQRLMLELAERDELTSKEQRTFNLLVRAEKTAERALKAKADVARVLSTEQREQRKKRNHELYKAAGLMSLAGVVDKKTGKLSVDAGMLVGLLSALKMKNQSIAGLEAYKAQGDAILASAELKKSQGDHNEL